mgnify:CR=1 FL=1
MSYLLQPSSYSLVELGNDHKTKHCFQVSVYFLVCNGLLTEHRSMVLATVPCSSRQTISHLWAA